MLRLTAHEIEGELKGLGSKTRAKSSERFFKTGKGQYGEGDVFFGVTVPKQRIIAKKYATLSFKEIEKLLTNNVHECRLTALLILIEQYKRGDEKSKIAIAKFYLTHTKWVHNWDMVDVSAPIILGNHLLKRNRKMLYALARSKDVWERRIAIVSTFAFIRAGESEDTFSIARLLLADSHDLIHKAVGWMLREVGKRVSRSKLTHFIDSHIQHMPRTTLRYAVEHYPPEFRKDFLSR